MYLVNKSLVLTSKYVAHYAFVANEITVWPKYISFTYVFTNKDLLGSDPSSESADTGYFISYFSCG